MRIAALALGLPLLLAACQQDLLRVELPSAEIVVHAVLMAGDTLAAVSVSRVTPGSEPGAPASVEPVRGARLVLRTPGGEVRLDEESLQQVCDMTRWPALRTTRSGCYVASVAGGILPGHRYHLRGDLSDGDLFTGVANVPHPPVIEQPGEGSIVESEWKEDVLASRERLEFVWHATTGTAAIGVAARVVRLSVDGVPAPVTECSIAGSGATLLAPDKESARWLLRAHGCAPDEKDLSASPADSLHFDLFLIAHDQAYLRYFHAWQESAVKRADLQVGLEGAVGIFSGAAPAGRRIVMVATGPGGGP